MQRYAKLYVFMRVARLVTSAGFVSPMLSRCNEIALPSASVRNAEAAGSSPAPSTSFFERLILRSAQIQPIQIDGERIELALIRRVRVALQHPHRLVARDGHDGVVIKPHRDHSADSRVPQRV